MRGSLLGALYFAVRRDRRGAIVVGAVVASHWLLDLPMHGADLPLWPGSVKVGLGAWNSVALTFVLEGVTFFAGLVVYLRATKARDRIGSWALCAMVAVLVAIFVGSSYGPPPASEQALALSALGLWLFVPWSYWIDRHRDEDRIASKR